MIFRSFRVFVLSPIPKNENSEITETHQKPQNTEMWIRHFKNSRNIVQITSKLQWFSHIANHATANWILKAFNPSEYIELSPFLFMSVLTQTVKKVVKTQIHMHWSAINQKIKIFRDFRVFVLCPIPKNENSEILEIHQNLQNTEMWVCNFRNFLNTVQTTSISKWSSHVANHVAAEWVLKAFEPSEYIKLNPFLFMSVLILKQLKKWSKHRSTCIGVL